ncbi:MAG: DUF2802 domain-containing protein [Granulosicoccus sp.]
MNGLIILSIALTALVGVLCNLMYRQQAEALLQIRSQQQLLDKLQSTLIGLVGTHSNMAKRIDQLATDVLQREIYQNADDRHQLAIQSAKQGQGLFELMQRHGLSSDEAALICSLHSPQNNSNGSTVKNANLVDPSLVDLV